MEGIHNVSDVQYDFCLKIYCKSCGEKKKRDYVYFIKSA